MCYPTLTSQMHAPKDCQLRQGAPRPFQLMKDNLTGPQAGILSVYHVRCSFIPYTKFVHMGCINVIRALSSQHLNQLRGKFIKLKAQRILRFLFKLVFTLSLFSSSLPLSLSFPSCLTWNFQLELLPLLNLTCNHLFSHHFSNSRNSPKFG